MESFSFLFILVLGLVAVHGLSLFVASRVHSLAVVHGLLVSVAFLISEHRHWSAGSVVIVHRLSCPMAGEIFPKISCLKEGFLWGWWKIRLEVKHVSGKFSVRKRNHSQHISAYCLFLRCFCKESASECVDRRPGVPGQQVEPLLLDAWTLAGR